MVWYDVPVPDPIPVWYLSSATGLMKVPADETATVSPALRLTNPASSQLLLSSNPVNKFTTVPFTSPVWNTSSNEMRVVMMLMMEESE